MHEIRFVTANECLELRSKVLRPNQPINVCHYPEDNHKDSFHIGYFIDQKMVGNGTFLPNANPDFSLSIKPYRLRGMAVDSAHQGQNIGTKILLRGLDILQEKQADLLWFNARESAFHFYEKNGFLFHGRIFDIPTIGPHKVMYKHL